MTIPSDDHQHHSQKVMHLTPGDDSGIGNNDESCKDGERPRKESDIQSMLPTAKSSTRASTLRDGECERAQGGGSVRQMVAHLYCGFSQSLLLENTASVARDHLGNSLSLWSARPCLFVPKDIYHILLANERTFLAWLRTSMALITVGVGKAYRLVLYILG